MQTPEDVLQKYWKFSQFKGLQKEAISACIEGKDTCVFFPTGGGKSICFQIPALLKDGVCIVVSPLISLMQDQVNSLNSKGIKAIHLKGGLSYKETDRIFDNIRNANFKFLYLSPEKLQNTILQERLKYINVNLVAIDEAHCVSQWGHDFRPAYLEIATLRDIHPEVPLMVLTATATQKVQEDILKQLKLKSPYVFKSSFKRSNIALNVIETDNKWKSLIEFANSSKSSGIVYVRSRKSTIDLSKLLNQNGITSKAFHGGLLNKDRRQVLEEWLDNTTKIVVATTAFGMGIDKADVDLIIHINLPESLESYYQEVGRAGRNGKPAKAILLYNKTDIKRLRYQFLNNLPEIKGIKNVYRHLMSYLQIAYGEGSGDEYGLNLQNFCSRYKLDLPYAFEILKLLDRLSLLSLDQNYQINAILRILIPHQQLFDFLRKHTAYNEVMTYILRNYAGVFDLNVKIDLEYLARKLRTSQKKIAKKLKALEELDVLELKLNEQDLNLRMLQPREDDRSINTQKKYIEAYRTQKINQIEAVVNFINNENECRQVQLLQYFDEDNLKPCGKCSVCMQKSGQLGNGELNQQSLQKKIESLLKKGPGSSTDIFHQLDCKQSIFLEVIEEMLKQNKIELTTNNLYKLIE
jgi:ATP-dependent DNA helicase RecQ